MSLIPGSGWCAFRRSLCLLLLISTSGVVSAQLAASGWPKILGTSLNNGQSTGGNTLPSPKWTAKGIAGSPIIGLNGIVYIGLTALDGATGTILWSVPTRIAPNCFPTVGQDGTVYVCLVSADYVATLNALDGSTGATKWSTILSNTSSTPSIGPDGTVYCIVYPDNNNDDGESFNAYDGQTGDLKWTFQLGNTVTNGVVVFDPAIGSDGTIYIAAEELENQFGHVYALDPSTGSILRQSTWSQIVGFTPSAAPSMGPDGTIYVPSTADSEPKIYAFDSLTLNSTGIFPTAQPLNVTISVGRDGTLYFTSADHYVYAFDGKTGATKWQYFVGGSGVFGATSPIIGSDGIVYIANENGNIYALDSATGSLIWSYATDPSYLNSALGADGTLVFGAQSANSNYLVALSSIQVVSLVLNPSTVVGGNPVSGTVNLNYPAPSSGLVVSLGSDMNVASPPSKVTVPAGQLSTSFSVSTTPVSAPVTAIITAQPGIDVTATLTIDPAPLVSVSVNPSTVAAGGTSTGTVTLGSKAGPSGITVSLSTNNSAATVPTSVTVASGQTSATFAISAGGVDKPTNVAVIGSFNGVSQSASLTINPSALTSLSVNPTTVVGGNPSTGTVSLNGPAGPSGTVVRLSSNDSISKPPASVTVPSGLMSTNFTVATIGVSAQATSTITAQLDSKSNTAYLTVNPATLVSVSVNPTAVSGGNPSTGTISLNGQAGPGGISVSLSSSSSVASVPALCVVPAGQASGTFMVSTTGVSAQSSATITAKFGQKTPTTTLTIVAATLSYVSFNPTSVVGGNPSTGTVFLSGQAPAHGLVVSLSSNNSDATLPATVTISAGKSNSTFKLSTLPVKAMTVASISAKLAGITSSALLTINPPSLASIAFSPSTVEGGSKSTGTITLSGPAPKGGVLVSLSSNNPAASIPASVTVSAGQTSVTFSAKTTAVLVKTVDQVTATANGLSVSAGLAINAPSLTGLTLSPSTVRGGESSKGTVTISSAAPAGGLVITLKSSQSGASAPATVTVAAGKTTATFSIATTSVTSKTSSSISATLATTTLSATLTIS